MIKLTNTELEDALQKGLGRAYLHVKDNGDYRTEDILLNALKNNLVYANLKVTERTGST